MGNDYLNWSISYRWMIGFGFGGFLTIDVVEVDNNDCQKHRDGESGGDKFQIFLFVGEVVVPSFYLIKYWFHRFIKIIWKFNFKSTILTSL